MYFCLKQTKVWDIRMNETPLFSLSNNVKTVNSVFVSEQDNRLITGSVDCHVKVYDMAEVIYPYSVQNRQPSQIPKAYHLSDLHARFESLLCGNGRRILVHHQK